MYHDFSGWLVIFAILLDYQVLMVLWLPLTSGSLTIPTTPVTRYFWWVIEAERAFKKWCRAFYFLAFFLWLQRLTECCLLNISVYCVLCTVPVSFSWSPDCTHAFYYKTGITSFKNRRVLCKEHENVCYVLQLLFVSIFSNNKKKFCFYKKVLFGSFPQPFCPSQC